VVGLGRSHDPESCAVGSVTGGRAPSRQTVNGDDPDKKGYPGSPGWGFGLVLRIPPHKKCCVDKLLKI